MSSQKIKIGVVVVHYRDFESTNQLCYSLSTQQGICIETIIVNNDRDNIGYGGACNYGAKLALWKCCDAVLYLNNDIKITRKFFVRDLYNSLYNTGADIASPVVMSSCGKKTMTSARIDYSGLKWLKKESAFRYVAGDAINGCCFIVKPIVAKCVSFSDKFFMYCEDIKYSIDAVNFGFRIVYDQRLFIVHDGHAKWDSVFSRYYQTRNLAPVMLMKYGILWYAYFLLYFIPARMIYFMYKNKFCLCKAMIKGINAFWSGEQGRSDYVTS